MSFTRFRTAASFRRAALLGLSLLAASSLGATAAFAQAKQAIAGTTVSLAPMPGFAPASGFAGLQNAKTQASVLVVEMPPVAHEQISPLFKDVETAKVAFAKQNVTVEKLEEIDSPAGKAPLITGRQTAAGTSFDKWIGLYKGEKTVMVTVQSPTKAKLRAAEVKAMMASVSLGAEPSMADKLKAMPFTIKPAEPFRILDAMGGSSVLMTAGPLNTDPAGEQPLLIAVYQLSGPTTAAQLPQAAEQLLRQTRDFGDATIERREAVPFAGSQGMLLAGTYTHAKAGKRRFEQYMAVGESGRFVRMIVMADDASFESLRPAIAAIAGSVAFNDAK